MAAVHGTLETMKDIQVWVDKGKLRRRSLDKRFIY